MTDHDIGLIGRLADELRKHGVSEARVMSLDGLQVELSMSPFAPYSNQPEEAEEELEDIRENPRLFPDQDFPVFTRVAEKRKQRASKE